MFYDFIAMKLIRADTHIWADTPRAEREAIVARAWERVKPEERERILARYPA